MSNLRFARSKIEHLISKKFRFFQAPERIGGVPENETRASAAPKSLLPLQVDRRRAIADRVGNVKIRSEAAGRSSPSAGANPGNSPEFSPRQLFSPGSTDFSEVFTPCAGHTRGDCIAYGER
jgi:hypothetical protein